MIIKNMLFDYLIFIGRFQPFHLGHKFITTEGLAISKNIIILCGTAGNERSLKNPWNFDERNEMIYSNFPKEVQSRLIIRILNDVDTDQAWVENIYKIVSAIAESNSKIGIIGHFKDESSYYLNLFPKWELVSLVNHCNISATNIRNDLYKHNYLTNQNKALIPEATNLFLEKFILTEEFQNLLEKI